MMLGRKASGAPRAGGAELKAGAADDWGVRAAVILMEALASHKQHRGLGSIKRYALFGSNDFSVM